MSRLSKEDRAFRSAEKLARIRSELEIAEAQISALRDDADEAQVRALVTDHAADRTVYAEAARHVAALERSREDLLRRLDRARREHAELLDRLFPGSDSRSSTG